MNDLGFEQTADRLGEFIVVGIATDGGSFYDEVSAKRRRAEAQARVAVPDRAREPARLRPDTIVS